jgi:hypothetical protein
MSTLNILDFILLALATYRVTRLLVRDTIFASLRNRIWNRYPPETTKRGYLLTCEWCTSVYVGLGFATWYTISSEVVRFFAVALALSAIAGLLTAYEDRN